MRALSWDQWVAWIAATVVAAITMTAGVIVHAYGTFETKDAATQKQALVSKSQDEKNLDIARRLERMEQKIDDLLSRRR